MTKDLNDDYNIFNAMKGNSSTDVQQTENWWLMKTNALSDESVLEWNQSFPVATVIRNEEV